MRAVELAKVAASAEALRLRRLARRQALHAAFWPNELPSGLDPEIPYLITTAGGGSDGNFTAALGTIRFVPRLAH